MFFGDAWRRDDKRFRDLMLPHLRPAGLFCAYVVNRASEMRDFLRAIKNDSRLLTTIVTVSGEGMSLSLEVR